MKKSSIVLALLAAVVFLGACNKVPRSGKMNFKTQMDSVSYALGYMEGNNFKKTFERVPFEMDSMTFVNMAKTVAKTKLTKQYTNYRIKQFDNFNEDAFYKGFLNEVAYGKSYFTQMSADIFLRKVLNEKKALKDSLKLEKGKIALEKGVKFLEENKKKDGVKVTESGLQYEIIKKGNGNIPVRIDRVKCVYHGTLLDGTVFDSSKERGDTTTFGVNRVIKGWTEALQMMPEGSEWRLYIPSDLAYGQRGAGENIGPNETLIFDLNLIEIQETIK
ncbi:FKBP-type peptidyl-prolyl cis-trans isomerase [Marinifilum sp. N1E240]|uniref:FKBP-type peptidyl-prolyl cis-trans isomerase n=1 Tax=Marinifilum sp. N1E240 TaxID=2608082 RepID=UPI00128E1CB5|nr:FKBP-type peptidyl-prolyl cis-trans isomerase [Marinifilum sp. N1E240]MPQ47788.1 FKBP-type peptidyl-prolyl cis-trans isomerase [Marinifilum sp. N1E240]